MSALLLMCTFPRTWLCTLDFFASTATTHAQHHNCVRSLMLTARPSPGNSSRRFFTVSLVTLVVSFFVAALLSTPLAASAVGTAVFAFLVTRTARGRSSSLALPHANALLGSRPSRAADAARPLRCSGNTNPGSASPLAPSSSSSESLESAVQRPQTWSSFAHMW